MVPFPVSVQIPVIHAVKHPLASRSVTFPSCVCAQIGFDQVSHCGRCSEQCGGAARVEQGHFALLWSPADGDRLLHNVTLPVLWVWRRVQGVGSGFLSLRHPCSLLVLVRSSSNWARSLRDTKCPRTLVSRPLRPQRCASQLPMVAEITVSPPQEVRCTVSFKVGRRDNDERRRHVKPDFYRKWLRKFPISHLALPRAISAISSAIYGRKRILF